MHCDLWKQVSHLPRLPGATALHSFGFELLSVVVLGVVFTGIVVLRAVVVTEMLVVVTVLWSQLGHAPQVFWQTLNWPSNLEHQKPEPNWSVAEISDVQLVYLTPLKVIVERGPSESSHGLLQLSVTVVLAAEVVDKVVPVNVVVLPAVVVNVVPVPSPSVENAEHVPITFWTESHISLLRYLLLNWYSPPSLPSP
jgi:hypothetical protein